MHLGKEHSANASSIIPSPHIKHKENMISKLQCVFYKEICKSR